MKNARLTHTVRSTLKRGLLTFTLLGGLTACQDSGTDNSVDRPAPGYVQLHEAYLASSCGAGACHGGDQGIMGLSFDDPELAYARLIDGAPKMGAAAAAGLT